MTNVLSNAQQAQVTAANRAVAMLADVDLKMRCANLGVGGPAADGTLLLRMLGGDLRLSPPEFAATWVAGKALKSNTVSHADRLLALHFLLCDKVLAATGELISFRELPGGNFYFGPFSNRTTKALAGRIGNDIERLRKNLARFDTTPATGAPVADLAASIHVIGPIHLTLLYHLADEESPASAEVLFDSCIKNAFNTEDIAVLSSRICFSLI